ncbi:uncharacterized protein LOC111289561 isoform X1 [Durio zibethinus]|uniref:2-C-methyl-D-erythritol 2,4-cyclodiphosphate synthase n=1 Tax=Durio zibethinus TaxID=66656 RepID=A0A6P5Y7L6_DURZI|nr:uncharacterized protein LOC111289561 isoform X1 [Durio zibethinus]
MPLVTMRIKKEKKKKGKILCPQIIIIIIKKKKHETHETESTKKLKLPHEKHSPFFAKTKISTAMAINFYSCSPIPAKPTSTAISNKSILLPNPRISPAGHHSKLAPSSSSSAVALRASISPAATSVAFDGPATSTKPSKSLPFRVGHGFDLHRLEPGYPLIIGGIDIPHDRGCEAHSDGDVLLHCVVDAILGALGLPDIGQIFPDSDPKWKGAPSSVFIKEAYIYALQASISMTDNRAFPWSFPWSLFMAYWNSTSQSATFLLRLHNSGNCIHTSFEYLQLKNMCSLLSLSCLHSTQASSVEYRHPGYYSILGNKRLTPNKLVPSDLFLPYPYFIPYSSSRVPMAFLAPNHPIVSLH